MTRSNGLALGTVQFGLSYGVAGRSTPVPEGEVRAILRRASDAGVSRLDTAPAYGDIEARLASLVGDLPFGVVSKVPALPQSLRSTERREFVHNQILRSHDRLGDLLQGMLFHDGAAIAEDDGRSIWCVAAETCARLGIELGISGYAPDEISALSDDFPLAMTQLPGNAFDQRLAKLAPSLEGTEVTLRSVFLQGLLLMPADEGARRLPAASAALNRWHAWCQQHEMDPLDAAIAICKGMQGASYCVVGVDGLAQFEQIVQAWNCAVPISVPELAQSDLDLIDPRRWPRN